MFNVSYNHLAFHFARFKRLVITPLLSAMPVTLFSLPTASYALTATKLQMVAGELQEFAS